MEISEIIKELHKMENEWMVCLDCGIGSILSDNHVGVCMNCRRVVCGDCYIKSHSNRHFNTTECTHQMDLTNE